MIAIILALFSSLRQGLKTRAALHAEIIAIRHQLLVLQRGKRSRKLRLSVADRFLWTWLSQLWSGWRSVLVIVKPETVIALAPARIPPVLELEKPPSTGPAFRTSGSHRSDPQNEFGQPSLGCASHPRRTLEAGIRAL
jgi:hypothetical protein